jgi:hypothetical protein
MHRIAQSIFRMLMLAPLIVGIGSVSFGQVESQSNVPTNSATVVGKDYTLTIQTAKDVYEPDERILLLVTVKYTGATEVTFSADPGPIYSNLTVLWNDKPCPQTLYGKHAIDNPFNYGHGVWIRAGWEGRTPYHLNRVFDMTVIGDYKISLRSVGLEAGPITIHIHDSGLKP